jgi:putative pyruvate formate lyase activating enzyme
MNSEMYHLIPGRIDALKQNLQSCRLCPRNCGVNRLAGQTGYCGVDDQLYCFREMLYCGEEKELCPSTPGIFCRVQYAV